MLFDWFTIIAQIFNFLLLMWLLKRFLYKPVLDAIDAREARIATLLKETQASQEQAAGQQAELSTKNAAFETERVGLFEQAKADAAERQKQLLDQAAHEVATQREQWLLALKKEQQTLDQDINQRTRHEVLNVARRALADLSDSELEVQIVKVLIHRVEAMTSEQRKAFNQTADSPNNEVLVRSAFEFTAEQQATLTESLQGVLPTKPAVKFAHDEHLIGGVELVGNGHKLSWNLDAYLSDLDASIKGLIDNKLRFSGAQSNGGA